MPLLLIFIIMLHENNSYVSSIDKIKFFEIKFILKTTNILLIKWELRRKLLKKAMVRSLRKAKR